MDENNRRRRQNDPPYSGPDPRFNADPNQGRGFPISSTDRFRPTPITNPSSTGRGVGGTVAYSGYYQEPTPSFPGTLSQGAMHYQAGYSQDQRQQNNFTGYNPDIMYNVPSQSQQSNVYDANTQFQSRQPAAIQLLSDVATPYFPDEPTTSTAPPPSHQQPSSSTPSSAYQQHHGSPDGRSSLLPQSYQANLTMSSIASNAPELMPGEEFQAEGPGMEAAYIAYQTALKEVFQDIINCRLAEASRSLLEVSEWLLGHVGDLGLTVDETALHADRIRLWGEFNTAWLGIFQKQKDLLESGQRLQQIQSLMSQDFTRKMAKDLVRMCDAIEKYGLVDYQYGVAEEQIIAILEECLDLQQSLEGIGGGPGLGREAN